MKCQYKIYLILFLFAGTFVSALANPFYTIPFITHFPKITYDAGYQNWDIMQDESGVLYFANNNGLLIYNTKSWRCYPLPNKTILRSIEAGPEDFIFAGGQNEIGYYYPDKNGKWVFKSLKELIPEGEKEFEDVWDILVHKDYGVLFLTTDKLFQYKNGKINTYKPVGHFNSLGLVQSDVVVQDNNEGLYLFTGDTIKPYPGGEIFRNQIITTFLKLSDGRDLIATLKDGFYISDGKSFTKWYENRLNFFSEYWIYSAALLNDGRLVIGTSLNGIYIVGMDGRVQQHVNENSGLNDNNILSILVDRHQNIWLGLDYGIDYLHTNSPYSRISTDGVMEGAGYDLEIIDNKVFFGTSKGIYYSVINENNELNYQHKIFELSDYRGQVWGMNKIDNQLLIGHHEGGLVLDFPEVTKISPNFGVWLFQILKANPEYMLAGTYRGISLYRKTSGGWRYSHQIAGFEESSRFVEQDKDGNIWVSHPYKGIYKLELNEALDSAKVLEYGSKNGLFSDLSNYLFKINEDLLVCSGQGVYSYNEVADSFEVNSTFNSILGWDSKVIRLFEAPNGAIWYVTSDGLGELEVEDKSFSKEITNKTFPGKRKLLVNGFEILYPLNDSNIVIGAEKGFIHLNPLKNIYEEGAINVIFDEISITSDFKDVIFCGNGLKPDTGLVNLSTPLDPFPARMNSFHFSFTTTEYNNAEIIQYRYYLEGAERAWSSWTSQNEKEFTHLRHGKYIFHIQARDGRGVTSPLSSYAFIISPPWYQTKLAYLIYSLVVVGILVWMILFLRSKYMVQKEKVIHTEKQVRQLKEERLQAEVSFKNRELIAASMHIGHKNNMLEKIERAVEKISGETSDQQAARQLLQVIKMIRSEEGSDREIRQFTKLFNEAHPGFQDRIKKKFPKLSSKDLKMCSYIRMNMSTKEIASISNMTIRGVEGSRYRLRKKLNLSKDTDLSMFILHF